MFTSCWQSPTFYCSSTGYVVMIKCNSQKHVGNFRSSDAVTGSLLDIFYGNINVFVVSKIGKLGTSGFDTNALCGLPRQSWHWE